MYDYRCGGAEVIEKTNDKGIDAIADNSTIIYRRVGISMREYIEKTHGDIATIAVAKAILHNGDKAGLKQAKKELGKLPEEKRKNLTAEKLFEAGKDSAALDAYKENCKGNKVKRTDLIPRGKKVYQEKLAKENWNAKIIEMQKIADDLAKISQNMNVLAQDIAAKITAKSNDIALLAQNPVMQEFVSGSRLDAEIDVLSDLRFPCRTVLLGLPFFVFSATLRTRNDYGKIVFLAQFITQFPDVVIGLFAVVIFVVFDVVSSAKNDVIMNVSFVNMGGNNIRIFSL